MVVQFDHENKRAPLFITAMELFEEKIRPKTESGEAPFTMYREFMPYQIEFVPLAPLDFQNLDAGKMFEKDFVLRFEAIKRYLDRDDI